MLKGNPITFQGFQIPSDNWLFLIILLVHVLLAIICVISGIIAMLAKKQIGIHSKVGNMYYYSIWMVFITASILAALRWREDYYLFILGAIAFSSAFIGRKALQNRWRKWGIIHIIGMGNSYIFLITAFYVDNGKFLPIWKNFHPMIYWLLPAVIGVPLILRTLFTHPLSRKYFEKSSNVPEENSPTD